jgi:ribonuclease Z
LQSVIDYDNTLVMAAIDVVLLGTGSPIPDPNRAGPSTLVRAGGATFLFDCGRGVLLRAAAVGATANTLTATFLTHLHSDHVTNLNDVITTRWVTTFVPVPLRLVGPPRTGEVVDGILASLAPDISYRIDHHDDLTWPPPVDVEEVTSGVVYDDGGVRVIAAPTDHRPVAPTLGYRVEHAGHAVVIAGDTVPCAGLDELCDGADAVVCTVIRDDLVRAVGVPRLVDVCDYHSTVEQAADTAKRAGVRTLVLTHCVPPIVPGTEDEWRQRASAVFDGDVVVGADLDQVVVG